MLSRNKNDRPITVGDIKRFRKDWLIGSFPVCMFIGIVLILAGIFSIFLDPYVADNTIPLAVIGIVVGAASIWLAYWAKNKAKKL